MIDVMYFHTGMDVNRSKRRQDSINLNLYAEIFYLEEFFFDRSGIIVHQTLPKITGFFSEGLCHINLQKRIR